MFTKKDAHVFVQLCLCNVRKQIASSIDLTSNTLRLHKIHDNPLFYGMNVMNVISRLSPLHFSAQCLVIIM